MWRQASVLCSLRGLSVRALCRRLHKAPQPVPFTDVLPAFWAERLRSAGLEHATPIQSLALPQLMSGASAVLQAETGTGKTLCYLLPLLEHLRKHVLEVAGGTRALAVCLIVVPTRELAHQVHTTALQLLPEGAHLMRVVSGGTPLGVRQACGLIIATPVAMQNNINFKQLGLLKALALDEADMLLSGAFLAPVQGYLLSRFKQRLPEHRPQHIFCGATLPQNGKKSVAAFLDRYYGPPAVLRIATPGVHRTLPRIPQTFVQLDAGLPLTALERASLELVEKRARAEAAAARTSTGRGGGADVPSAALDASPDAEDAGDGGSDGREQVVDAVADEMRRRVLEDNDADLRADYADYTARVAALRRYVLLEALLAPVETSVTADADSDILHPSSSLHANRGAAATATSGTLAVNASARVPVEAKQGRSARKRGRVDVLGLANGLVVRPSDADSEDAGCDSARAPEVVAPPMCLALPAGKIAGFVPLVGALSAQRSILTAAEIAGIPPTLVFVNSGTAAESLRKYLRGAAPDLR
jgi:hypothetical protein